MSICSDCWEVQVEKENKVGNTQILKKQTSRDRRQNFQFNGNERPGKGGQKATIMGGDFRVMKDSIPKPLKMIEKTNTGNRILKGFFLLFWGFFYRKQPLDFFYLD